MQNYFYKALEYLNMYVEVNRYEKSEDSSSKRTNIFEGKFFNQIFILKRDLYIKDIKERFIY